MRIDSCFPVLRGRCTRVAGPVLFCALLMLAGCGQTSVVPATGTARQALEAALSAWKDGKRPQALAEGAPVINAVDNDWTNGRVLTAFEITGEQPSDGDKRFTAKLTLDKPAGELETTYVVVGLSPITVFREDDFNRGMSMDNNPGGEPAKKKRVRGR